MTCSWIISSPSITILSVHGANITARRVTTILLFTINSFIVICHRGQQEKQERRAHRDRNARKAKRAWGITWLGRCRRCRGYRLGKDPNALMFYWITLLLAPHEHEPLQGKLAPAIQNKCRLKAIETRQTEQQLAIEPTLFNPLQSMKLFMTSLRTPQSQKVIGVIFLMEAITCLE